MGLHTKMVPGWIALLWLAPLVSLLGCTLSRGSRPTETLTYRSIQRDFNEAVLLDNTTAVDPFGEGQSALMYQEIAAKLTREQIERLDERLHANAWLLKAVAEWRSGQQQAAIASAESGLRAKGLQPHSRDHLLLTLLPALAVDSEMKEKWIAKGRVTTVQEYTAEDGYKRDFQTVFAYFDRAERTLGPGTPGSAIWYLHYQKWRVLNDWRLLIASLQGPGSTEARKTARTEAAAILGIDNLENEADRQRDAIPESHALRQLIRAQGGG